MTMDSTHITEIMPPDMPDWMWDAIEEGLLARRSMEKVADLDGIASRLVAVNLELRERIAELEAETFSMCVSHAILHIDNTDCPYCRITELKETVYARNNKIVALKLQLSAVKALDQRVMGGRLEWVRAIYSALEEPVPEWAALQQEQGDG